MSEESKADKHVDDGGIGLNYKFVSDPSDLSEDTDKGDDPESDDDPKGDDPDNDDSKAEGKKGPEDEKGDDPDKDTAPESDVDPEDGKDDPEKKSDDPESDPEDDDDPDDDKTEAQISDEDINSYLKEKYEGKYESIDDLIEKAESDNTPQITTYEELTEHMNKISEEVHGLPYNEVLELKNKDYDSMDGFDAIEVNMRLNDPDITDDEIEVKLEEYEILSKTDEQLEEMKEEGDITDSQIRRIKAQYNRDVREAKRTLKETADGIEFDELNVNIGEQKDNKEQPPAVDKDELKGKVLDQFKDFEKINLKIDKDNDVEVNVLPEQREDFAESYADFQSFISDRWFSEDGKHLDPSKMIEDIILMKNKDQLFKAVWDKSRKDYVKESDNKDYSSGKKAPDGKKSDISDKRKATIAKAYGY